MNLLSFEGYQMLSESADTFSKELDNILNENIGAALGSPIKFIKIKNNAKKYQQALVQIAINNLDFEKKKQAGTLDKDKEDILAAANKQKNTALRDKADAISTRMDQLAVTDGLKTVASIAKNKSKMAAAETALKTADGEEAKALKLKIQGLNAKVAADQKELKDYQKKADDKKEPGEVNQQNLDNVKRTPDKKPKTTPTEDAGKKPKTTPTEDAGKKPKTSTSTSTTQNTTDKKEGGAKAGGPPPPPPPPPGAKRKEGGAKAGGAKAGGPPPPPPPPPGAKRKEGGAPPGKKKEDEGEGEPKKKKAGNESYVNESVASKFRRLMENKF